MKYLDLTLPTPESNLACDEALLNLCEEGRESGVLRVWEPQNYFVVLGYANRADVEVNLDKCRERNVPVFRRCSGGGTVLQGPGCFNYTLVLRIADNPRFESITGTNAAIMELHRAMAEAVLLERVEVRGTTDLALGELKFSGNAQRRKRDFLLFHGTFLLNFDLAQISELLHFPSKQPDYRRDRSHSNFVRNVCSLSRDAVKQALRKTWQAAGPLEDVPWAAMDRLVKEQYSSEEWIFRDLSNRV
jgi:lipoate---protein ligase